MKKRQYTKKQITEAIAYWQRRLKMMNESAELENEVCSNLKKIIDKTINNVSYSGDGGTKVWPGHPKKTKFATDKYWWGKYNVFHTGNSKDASDIYVSFPVSKDAQQSMTVNDIDFVGIEVKESPTSKLFNPQLSYSYSDNELQFSNEFLNTADDSVRDFFSELVGGDERSSMEIKLNAIMKFFEGLGVGIDSFPWNYKKNGFSSQNDFIDYLFYSSVQSFSIKDENGSVTKIDRDSCSKQEFRSRYLAAQQDSSYVDETHTKEFRKAESDLVFEYGNRLPLQLITGKIKRLPLASYKVLDNSIIKSYFHSLRAKSDTYMPVYYMQFGDALYKLIDDNSKQSRFFKSNGTYKVLPYDSAFNGVRISWYIDFSNKASDNYIRIKGDVVSINNNGKQASLTDIAQVPVVDISKSYLHNLSKYLY